MSPFMVNMLELECKNRGTYRYITTYQKTSIRTAL